MITGEIKNKIDSIWDDFFSAGMSDFYKSMMYLLKKDVKNTFNFI